MHSSSKTPAAAGASPAGGVPRPWLWRTALALLVAALPYPANSQEAALDWTSSRLFRFNVLNASFNASNRTLTVVFSVTNPQGGNAPYDILDVARPPFLTAAGARLGLDIGWDTGATGATELVNTGNVPVLTFPTRTWMNSVPPAPGGFGPANPKTVNALTGARRCDSSGAPCAGYANPNLTFFATAVLPAEAVGAGRVAMEGHAVRQTGTDALGAPVYVNIPITGAVLDFAIDATAVARRQVVDINKCKVCHDGGKHGDTVVPRLALHGGNRTEEPALCVVCHNPNQTDVAYRSSGAEESIDFKRLVHGIHAGGFREKPLVIIGFRGSVNDYGHVRFPSALRNCTTCHIDANGKGTFEVSAGNLLGSTVVSGSAISPLPGFLDVNPTPDLRISPIAAACSSCHDKAEVRRHMISQGASFGATQAGLAGKERCINCHGAGRSEDVRKAHEIRSASRSSRD